MDSPLIEPLLGTNDHRPDDGATVDESSTFMDKATDVLADEASNLSTDVPADEASNLSTDAPADEASTIVGKDHDDDAEGESMSSSISKENEDDDAEADAMAAFMEQRLATLPGKAHKSEPFTIFRVAGPMRERNRHLYEPQMVSIGPFHRGASPRLAAMEEHKWRYLRDLLARAASAPLSAYARAARAMEPHARRRYAEPVPLSLAETLVLDGCFLVEFFLKGEENADDALVDAAWAMQNVYNDLFLLENQLPFFVVERFYELATGRGRDHLVGDVLVKYLTVDMGTVARRPPDGEIHHLLHLYYHWFLPPEEDSKPSSGDSKDKEEDEAFLKEWTSKPAEERAACLLPPASELEDAGVKLRAKPSPRSLVDVTFRARGGVLEIPAVEGYTSHAIFANLLAYEQSRGRRELQRLVSYVLLMASLAGARRDAEALRRAGVLSAGAGEKAAFYAHLAAELCPPPEFVDNCYAGLASEVRDYCGRSWNRHRAVLVHDYLSNPWTSMSAAAAVLLLVLTVVQTVYTVLPYYNTNASG